MVSLPLYEKQQNYDLEFTHTISLTYFSSYLTQKTRLNYVVYNFNYLCSRYEFIWFKLNTYSNANLLCIDLLFLLKFRKNILRGYCYHNHLFALPHPTSLAFVNNENSLFTMEFIIQVSFILLFFLFWKAVSHCWVHLTLLFFFLVSL